MQGVGKRLRSRARELGLTDVDVARRVDLSQQRYANYVNDTNEPDLGTFVRICRALDTTPDDMLGLSDPPAQSEHDLLRSRGSAALAAMSTSRLRVAAALLDTLAALPDDA